MACRQQIDVHVVDCLLDKPFKEETTMIRKRLFGIALLLMLVALLYLLTLGFWIVAAKPIQFYYHYLLPSMFLLAALALACKYRK